MTNIQDEVQKIHHQYGMSEMENYKIQLLCEKYAKEYHDSEVKKLNIPAVMGELTCDSCGCHPNVIYTTSRGRFCEGCKPAS